MVEVCSSTKKKSSMLMLREFVNGLRSVCYIYICRALFVPVVTLCGVIVEQGLRFLGKWTNAPLVYYSLILERSDHGERNFEPHARLSDSSTEDLKPIEVPKQAVVPLRRPGRIMHAL